MTEASHPETRIADALPDHWADRVLPGALRPYARLMRLERPIGGWLLLLPCWWGLALGQIAYGGGVPSPWYALLFLAGAIIMRGAGCTLNDIADRNFDGRVERTRLRPIPAGQVLLIVAVYPFMKRITYWPQAVLGLAFNWGALVGWESIHGSLSLAPVLLYAGGVSWTLAYDTIYAHQDKEDDALIGLKSTALKFGDRSIWWLALFFALALALIDAAVWLAGGSIIAHLGIAAAAMQAAWQLARFQPDNGARCLELFRSNRIFGLIITLGFLLDSLII